MNKPKPIRDGVGVPWDRCTKAHEYLFLLTKNPRYFCDMEAVKESWTSGRDDMRKHGVRTGEAYIQQGLVMDNSEKGDRKAERNQHDYSGGRNKRSVWTVATQPYKKAHFATFPPRLIEPCVLAGCPAGGVVFDPFMGSGTTGFVAVENGRDYLGIELNPEYIEMITARIRNAQKPLFT